MNSVAAEQQDMTAYDVLRSMEDTYAPRLRGASLVIEADFEEDDVDQALRAFGAEFRRLDRNGDSPKRLWSTFPAVSLVGMAGAGSLRAGGGSYWPQLFSAVGIDDHQYHQSMFGRGFLRALERFDLPTFPDIPRPFVGPILMHAGIPSESVGDLVELLVRRRSIDPGMTATSFLAWGLSPGLEYSRLYSVGKPVRYFLEDGEEFALDIIDRLLELVDHLADHPEDSAPGVLTSATTGLPSVTVSKLCRLVRDNDVDLAAARRTRARGAAQPESVHLALNFDHSAVSVLLPSVPGASEVTWTLFADGGRQEVTSAARWVGANQQAPATALDLDRPVRRIQVTNSAGASSADVTLVDQRDPLLLFDDDGQLLPPRIPIPRGAVWALWPADRSLVDQQGSEPRVLVYEPEMPGWRGWRLAQIDTEPLASVALDGSDSGARTRRVRQDALPVIEIGDALPGIRSVSGQPVHASAPVITLPDDPSGHSKWTIELRHGASGERVVANRTVTYDDGQTIDPFADAPRPLVGPYTLRVRGALGRKVARRFWLAEELSVTCSPDVRRIEGPRIAAATVAIQSTGQLASEQDEIIFGQDEVEKLTEVSTPDGQRVPLVVCPPHMSVLVDAPGIAGKWSPSMARLTADQMTSGATIHISCPGLVQTPSLELRHQNERRQSIQPVGGGANNGFRFDLAKFQDTVREVQSAHLVIVGDGLRTDVATIRPPTYASGVEDHGDFVALADFVPNSEIKAGLYVVTAPWRHPEICEIDHDGTIPVPAALRNAGDLVVHLAEDDPWNDTTWPLWPVSNMLVCDRAGRFKSDDFTAEVLAALLDATADYLPTGMLDYPNDRVWKTLAALEHLGLPHGRYRVVSEEIADVVARDPDMSWISLINAGLPTDLSCELAIESGLCECPTSPYSDPKEVGELWPRDPVAAAFLAMSNLVRPGDTDAPDIRELDVDVDTYIGAATWTILDEKRDPHRGLGAFGQDARAMDTMRKAQVDALWHAAQVVPSGLLDGDGRADAAKSLFDARNSAILSGLFRELPSELRWMRKQIDDFGNALVKTQLDARMQTGDSPQPWQFLPALTFAYAACARFRAWFPGRLTPLRPSNRQLWRSIARVAPDMVKMDLVLADVLIAAPNRPTRTGDVDE